MSRDEGAEHAFLEPVVQLEDLVRQRQRDDDLASEVAHRQQREGEDGDDDHADAEHDLDGRREAAPEAPVAGGQPEGGDREQVEDPLDEDRAERPRHRRGAVDLQQVRPVDIAELRRHDAVHQPGQEDDLGRVLGRDPYPGAAQERRPAKAAQREAGIEDEHGREHQPAVRGEDQARDLRELPAIEHDEDRDHDDRDGDRQDRPGLSQPASDRHALRGELGLGGRGSRVGAGSRRRDHSAGDGGPGIDRGGGLHRGRQYGFVGPTSHRSMVLPRVGHAPTGGRFRPLPRARWTPLASGVQSRTA